MVWCILSILVNTRATDMQMEEEEERQRVYRYALVMGWIEVQADPRIMERFIFVGTKPPGVSEPKEIPRSDR